MVSQMHAKALQQLRQHIAGTLQNCAVHETWPVFASYTDHVQAFAAVVLKHKKDWLTVSDVYSIFIDHVYRMLQQRKPEDKHLEGNLKVILGEDGITQLTDQLLQYVQGIPRKYTAYIPLPEVAALQQSLEIDNSFRLVRVISRKELPGDSPVGGLLAMFTDELKPPQFFLVFETSGYCSRSFTSSAARQALSTFKISLQQALARGLFRRRKDTPAGLGFFASLSTYTIPKKYMVCVDQQGGAAPSVTLELPIEICRLLDSHSFADDNGQVAAAVASGTVDKLIISYLKASAQLHSTAKPEAMRVKSAIEWALDSYANDNPTLAFLQTCIALEALYGDDNDGENVTKTLSDRCAYLISSDIRGRKTIRDNFRSLYSIRSKIVHGSASSLASDEEHFLDWGKSILEYSIFKEIKHLAMEKT